MASQLTVSLVVAVLIVTVAAALVQGSLGLGLALVASPGLSLIDPAFVPGPVLAAALVSSTWMIYRDREHRIAEHFSWTLIGIPFGIPIGLLLLHLAPTSALMLALGLAVLLLAPLCASGRRGLTANPLTLGAGGFLSAVAGATVGLTGPTVAIVYNRLPPHRLRMTMAVYLTIVQTIALTALVATGAVGVEGLWLMALTVPGTAIGLALSGPIARVLEPQIARAAVVGVCCLAGASVTVRALMSMAHLP